VFLVSLKRSWNVDSENDLALVIRTSAAQVMGKRSQFDSRPLKVGNRPFYDVALKSETRRWKALDKNYNFDQNSSRSELRARSYGCSKFQESSWDSFGTPFRESQQNVPFGCSLGDQPVENTIWGKVVASPESGPWWILCVQVPMASPNTQRCPEC
jgi:hypothetical protein